MLCVGMSVQALANTTDDTTDYQCDFPISEGVDSVRAFTLSEAVYQCSQQNFFEDIQVVNAAGQAVPFSTITPKIEPKISTTKVPFYREPQQANFSSTAQIERILRASNTNPQHNSLESQGKRYFSSMIVNLNQISGQLVNFTIDATPKQPLQVNVVIEVSDNLEYWRIINSHQRYYFLPGENGALSNSQFTVPTYRGESYMRLSLISNTEGFHQHIQSISVQINESMPPPRINWSPTTAPQLNPLTERWQYHWSGKLPIKKIRFVPRQEILFYSGRLYQPKRKPATNTRVSTKQKIKNIIKAPANARQQKRDSEDRWSYRTGFNQYWISSGDETIVHDELTVDLRHQQQIEIAYSQPSNISKGQVPNVLIGWHDITIAFLAQGAGPYRLLVGKSSMVSKHQALPSQISALLNSANELVNLGANNNEFSPSGSTPKPHTTPSRKWTNYLLWGVILFAIALLSLMVFRLAKSMAKADET